MPLSPYEHTAVIDLFNTMLVILISYLLLAFSHGYTLFTDL